MTTSPAQPAQPAAPTQPVAATEPAQAVAPAAAPAAAPTPVSSEAASVPPAAAVGDAGEGGVGGLGDYRKARRQILHPVAVAHPYIQQAVTLGTGVVFDVGEQPVALGVDASALSPVDEHQDALGPPVEDMQGHIREIKKQTDKPFGVDLLLPRMIVEAGDQPFEKGVSYALADIIKTLPGKHLDFILKVQKEMRLPELTSNSAAGSTITRPHPPSHNHNWS